MDRSMPKRPDSRPPRPCGATFPCNLSRIVRGLIILLLPFVATGMMTLPILVGTLAAAVAVSVLLTFYGLARLAPRGTAGYGACRIIPFCRSQAE